MTPAAERHDLAIAAEVRGEQQLTARVLSDECRQLYIGRLDQSLEDGASIVIRFIKVDESDARSVHQQEPVAGSRFQSSA